MRSRNVPSRSRHPDRFTDSLYVLCLFTVGVDLMKHRQQFLTFAYSRLGVNNVKLLKAASRVPDELSESENKEKSLHSVGW